MPRPPAPIQQRIDFAIAVIDAERIIRDTYRRDAFDSGREWAARQERIDTYLEGLLLLILERDGLNVPDHAELTA